MPNHPDLTEPLTANKNVPKIDEINRIRLEAYGDETPEDTLTVARPKILGMDIPENPFWIPTFEINFSGWK